MPQDCQDVVLLLLREGNRGEAVELIREELGVSVLDAEETVEALSRRHGGGGAIVAPLALGALGLAALAGFLFS